MLYCSICLFTKIEPVYAVTVINGQAVCLDCTGYVQGGEHRRALTLVGGPR